MTVVSKLSVLLQTKRKVVRNPKNAFFVSKSWGDPLGIDEKPCFCTFPTRLDLLRDVGGFVAFRDPGPPSAPVENGADRIAKSIKKGTFVHFFSIPLLSLKEFGSARILSKKRVFGSKNCNF